jgi:hypothetical protein
MVRRYSPRAPCRSSGDSTKAKRLELTALFCSVLKSPARVDQRGPRCGHDWARLNLYAMVTATIV